MSEADDREAFASSVAKPSIAKSRNGSWLIMAVAGLVAFVAFFVVTKDNNATVDALVARSDIAAGKKLSIADFEIAKIRIADSSNVKTLTRSEFDKASDTEKYATRAILEGHIASTEDVGAKTVDSSQRTFSFDVDPADANGGNVEVGDNIDLVNNCGSMTAYKLKVVNVNKPSNKGITSAGNNRIVITVGVDDDTVLRAVAQTLDKDKFKVVLTNDRSNLQGHGAGSCGGSN